MQSFTEARRDRPADARGGLPGIWLRSRPARVRRVAPALAAVQGVAASRIPALGYGVGCALGNVILALWGGVIVLLMQG
jgi:hypothetical protein